MDKQLKEERVHHVFEKIYHKYDSMNSIISFQQHKLWRKSVMKQMAVREGGSALDVCCGTGDWTLSLSEQVGDTGKRSEEHTSELQSRFDLVCRLLLEKKKKKYVLARS